MGTGRGVNQRESSLAEAGGWKVQITGRRTKRRDTRARPGWEGDAAAIRSERARMTMCGRGLDGQRGSLEEAGKEQLVHDIRRRSGRWMRYGDIQEATRNGVAPSQPGGGRKERPNLVWSLARRIPSRQSGVWDGLLIFVTFCRRGRSMTRRKQDITCGGCLSTPSIPAPADNARSIRTAPRPRWA